MTPAVKPSAPPPVQQYDPMPTDESVHWSFEAVISTPTPTRGDLRGNIAFALPWEVTMRAALKALSDLPEDCDEFGSPSPDRLALGTAEWVLESLATAGLAAETVIPTKEGGVAFYITSTDAAHIFARIECDQEGQLWLLLSNRGTGHRTFRSIPHREAFRQEFDGIWAFLGL